jgi:hypothetical protein
VQRAQEQRE